MGPLSAIARSLDDRASNGTATAVVPSGGKRGATTAYVSYLKPVVDRILGTLFFALALPVIAVTGLLVLIQMGRPVFFTQARVGKDGRIFEMYKLRTMIADRRQQSLSIDGPERRVVHKSASDPRVTPLGRRLRALRLDELPQLWNVVVGDMSLVGPRPELKEIVEGYEPWQHERHHVKPGLTGLWQVSRRNGVPMHECTEVDIAYVRDITLASDIAILLVTPLAMLGRRGGF